MSAAQSGKSQVNRQPPGRRCIRATPLFATASSTHPDGPGRRRWSGARGRIRGRTGASRWAGRSFAARGDVVGAGLRGRCGRGGRAANSGPCISSRWGLWTSRPLTPARPRGEGEAAPPRLPNLLAAASGQLRQIRGIAVFLRAGIGAGLVLHHALLGGGVVDHGQLGGAQALDLVAQPRGFLEIQIGGGFAHPGFEIGQHRLEIVPDAMTSSAMPPSPISTSTWSRS